MLLFLICQEIHFFISNLNILKTTLACIWFSPVLGGNGLFTSMCNPILTLFYGEKSSPARKKSSYEDKPLAAQTPQRKRGFLSTHQTIVGKTFHHLRSLLSSLADAPHCWIWGSVRSKTIFGKSVIFNILKQSTGLTFLPSSLTRDDYGWMLHFCIVKNSVQSFIQRTELSFY